MSSNRFFSSLLAGLILTNLGIQAQMPLPQLVVSITVDQLRTDYMEAFMPLYGENGFRRLLKEGRQYPNAQYTSAGLDRASAIAAIATGTPPYDNGIVGLYWLNRKTLQPVFCVTNTDADNQKSSVPDFSARNLLVSTFGDELKSATENKAVVYSIAPYSDAAILSAGHAADGAFWIDDESGEWRGTTYYQSFPVWAQMRNTHVPLKKNLESTYWTPSNDLVGNFSYFLSGGLKKPFKHRFKGAEAIIHFKKSGLVNEEVSGMARFCLDNSLIGNDDVPDFLALTFYAGNYKEQPVNEAPIEMQDTYVRLDKALGEVLDAIEKRIGINHTLIVLTSTGCAPEDLSNPEKYKIPTGTFYINRTAALLNMYLIAIYGQGQYVEACYDNEIYLSHKLLEQKQLKLSEIQERAQTFLMQSSGVKNVYTAEQLQKGTDVPGLSKLHNAYNPQRSGDLLIQISPGWRLCNENTREEKLVRESNVPFPIIFMGNNLPSATIETPVTTECIAPTLAKTIRIRAPNACTTAPLPDIR